jgi:hypothetical protein
VAAEVERIVVDEEAGVRDFESRFRAHGKELIVWQELGQWWGAWRPEHGPVGVGSSQSTESVDGYGSAFEAAQATWGLFSRTQ